MAQAKTKANLSGLLDGVLAEEQQAAPPVIVQHAAPRVRRSSEIGEQETVLVGANLPPSYARNIALLHAETGKGKKVIIQEALDMYFKAKGGAALKL